MLRVNKLSKKFDKASILSGLSLSLAKGQIGVITGRSGAGKSLLLQCIAGLSHYDEGDIFLSDQAIQKGHVRPEIEA